MFGLRVGFLLAVASAILALAPGAAQARSPVEEEMQTLYNADGSGRLFANGPNTTWERCNADLSVCESAGTTREISTGSAPSGTVFRLQGHPLGPVWHGNLSIAGPPSVQGTLSANELVTPVLATWQGGWEGSFDQTQLAVCETPTGEGCVSISDPKYVNGPAGGGAVLDPAFVGRYLRVADARRGPGNIETADAYTSPYGHPIWPAEGDTAVAVVGRIGPATPQRPPTLSPAPLIEAWISSRGVAKVRCPLGCEAVLVGRHGRHTARATTAIASSATLRLTREARKRLGPGPAQFTVEVGGQTFARKIVNLGPRHKHPRHRP